MADRRSYVSRERYSDYEIDAHHARYDLSAAVPGADDLFYPGEPIYAPPRGRGRSPGRTLLVVLALAGSGWGLVQTEAVWRPWLTARVADVAAELARTRPDAEGVSAPSAVVTQGPQEPAPVEPLPSKEVARVAGADSGEPIAAEVQPETPPAAGDVAAGSEPPGSDRDETGTPTSPTGDAGVAPLPPPKADPADPYQKRALAAGLHPELSQVLLSRMSDADYRNAQIAVSKALTEAADADKFVWPRQKAPRLALFQVHFVAGAPADCRRYVVTVTKDGWSTTARPMEKCGIKKPGRGSSPS